MKTERLALLMLLAFSVVLAGHETAVAQEPIKVGVLTIRSGPATPVGDDILAGIETATRMQGKVLGRPVELVVEDSLWNPQQAVTKATKLVQQNRVAAILGTSTIEALALLPVADRLGVPIITSNAGAAAITRQRCNTWVFRTNPDELMSVASLQYLISQNPKLQAAKWFTIGHDYPWSRLVGGSVKSVKDLTYAGETFAPLDTTDWAPFIAQAKTAGATAVIMPVTLGTPLLQFIQQANEFGLTKDAVLVSPIGLPDWLVAKLGTVSQHVVSAGSWAAWRHEEQEPATKEFNEAFFKQHGRVSGMQSLQAASAAVMLYQAMSKAGSLEPAAVVRALETVETRTPVGPLRFQAGGRQALSPLFLGPYEPVNPPRYGAQFAQRAEAFPASKSLTQSAKESGCNLK
ncbi:MAG TPA: ABC transporter substrate-binding protein [Methylomirabilota bacterium]|jgi:ABC-type branched-subunit amino acid transport system substrate-binding protein|nr:ABC transporter substrate-binding protein [Methylomirabilota bacterium]